jgi:hypothetical protein
MTDSSSPRNGFEADIAPAEAIEGREAQRLMTAIQRYEEFLHSQSSKAGTASDERIRFYSGVMAACDGLASAAQNYDFTKSIPDLAGTSAETAYGQELANLLARPDLPLEVRTIYMDLYGEDLRQYEAATDAPAGAND